IVSTLVLARLLVPADFGLVAMAMSVIAVLELITSFSFDVALIQKPQLRREHYDTAWTLNVLLSCACAGLVAVLAYPSALLYEEPRLFEVMLVLASGWLLSGFENTGIVDFRRVLDFRREFYFLAAKRVLGFGITVTLAIALRSYWALVIGTLAGRAIGVLLSYILHDFRPRPSLAATRELFAFSGWLLVNNLLLVAQAKVPHFVVGRVFGPDELGLYTVGSDIAQIPSADLLAPINRVVFPGLSRQAANPDQMRSTFLDVTAVTAVFAVPAAFGLAAVAQPLVLVLLGQKWLEAVPIVQTLAFVSAIYGVTSINGAAYLALGEPRFITTIATLRLALLIPLVSLLTRSHGLQGAAFAELAAVVLGFGASAGMILWRLGIPARKFFARLWRPVAASAVMGHAVLALVDRWPAAASSLAALPLLLAAVALGIVIYFATLGLIWYVSGRPPGAERLLLDRLSQWSGRKGSGAG
ncbi:MAG: lipopolysaccharide biosynthesis protein, partial [Elioraea sp.]|nr:lipopolysaccharide biosynthesis protein [Elioraea sp.]